MNIAFLGLGNMGAGMARRLLDAGYPLRVWNRSAEKTAPLVSRGAIACASPASAVAGADLAITSLMDDASVRAVCDGPGGLFRAMAPRAIHLCVTTISPECAEWLSAGHAAHGSRYISGPVLGRPDAAAEGRLIQFLSGDAAAITEVQPVCRAFAAMTVPMAGPAGVANKQKLCLNFFIISLIEVMAESLTLAEKSGASPELLAQFFEGALAHPGLKSYARRLLDRDTRGEGGFSMRGGLKDVTLMLDAAERAECPLELAAVIRDKMRECISLGMGGADWSAIQQITRLRAGLPADHCEAGCG